ncbi:hypothetical protein GGR56DRAFT_640009 [Xylariaceae sp. FL0804]|nr:hypothetical protein GGR56DRAFT_640009 [Xylariaceae sp. FL0804]
MHVTGPWPRSLGLNLVSLISYLSSDSDGDAFLISRPCRRRQGPVNVTQHIHLYRRLRTYNRAGTGELGARVDQHPIFADLWRSPAAAAETDCFRLIELSRRPDSTRYWGKEADDKKGRKGH